VDRQTFDRLMLSHLSAAERFATRLTGDPANAEDILHDAIIKAANAVERFRGESSFKTWLFQIIVNVFRDRFKGQPDTRPPSEELPDPSAIDPADSSERQELGRIVVQHVSSLPQRQREVLVLIVYEQMPPGEVGKMLSMTEQNVRTTLFHARQQMKQKLAKYLQEDLGANRK
jgi:RNA polymerase sigma-70 factor (ECF subfamily)